MFTWRWLYNEENFNLLYGWTGLGWKGAFWLVPWAVRILLWVRTAKMDRSRSDFTGLCSWKIFKRKHFGVKMKPFQKNGVIKTIFCRPIARAFHRSNVLRLRPQTCRKRTRPIFSQYGPNKLVQYIYTLHEAEGWVQYEEIFESARACICQQSTNKKALTLLIIKLSSLRHCFHFARQIIFIEQLLNN